MNGLRTSPLSDKVINALIEATQTYTEMNTILNEYSIIRPILSDMLLLLDMYYIFHGRQPDVYQIVHSLYISVESTDMDETINNINVCIEFAKNNVQKADILTAGDLLKIDESMKIVNIKPLRAKYSHKSDQQIEVIWSILHDLYGPQRQYTLILETAIAFYRLITLPEESSFNLQTITILFSNLYRNDFAFRGLHRQWILFADPRLNIDSMPVDDAIIHILYIFRQIWTSTTDIIRRLNRKREELSHSLQMGFRRKIPSAFFLMLTEKICIRNQDVIEKLEISKKTATKYLKILEQEKFLYSIKHGREVFYFNNELRNFFQEMIGVSDNGEEKP